MRIAKAKLQQRERKAAWSLALAEGRVLRALDSLTSYPTIAARDAALAKSCGLAEIVKV